MRIRDWSSDVCASDLIATRLSLSQYLRLREGELKSGGFRRPSILADALEALFGAVFLDGGFDAAQKVIARQYEPVLVNVDRSEERRVGKECVSTCRSRWSPSHKKKNSTNMTQS